MIKVTLQTKNSTFVSLEAKGHADSAPYGQDLVCASISAIILGGFNALSGNEKDYEVKVEAGYAYLKSLVAPNAHDAVVLETIVTQIESVASSYPKNVALERK
jgi:uncharacterized protein YsxB (DUF464 family)